MSLLEQYEQEASISSTFRLGDVLANLPEYGPRDLTAENRREAPIFKRHKIDFRPPDDITHLAISSNQLVLVLKNKKLLRIDMRHPENPIEIELSKSFGDKNNLARIAHLFLDPTGNHCIISAVISESQGNYENLYLGPGKKVQLLNKFKGYLITAVGWNPLNKDKSTTSNILVGTGKGLVFETELLASDESKWIQMTASTEQYLKQCFDVGSDTGQVSAIQFYRFSPDNMFFIILTTNNHFYQFVGSVSANAEAPYFHNIFNTNSIQFQDMPGNLGYSQLDFLNSKDSNLPEAFAWLTEPGIYYGKIDVTPTSLQSGIVATDTALIPYSTDSSSRSVAQSRDKPIGMILTQFHVLVLFEDRTKAINVLNDQVVQEDTFVESFGLLRAIAKDPVQGTIWVFSDRVVYRYKVTNENRDIWQIYLSKENFDMAKKFARADPLKYDAVLRTEASYHFNRKDYSKSASLFAQSRQSFEETALKFLQLGNEEALKNYLACKLDSLSEEDVTQVTLLVMWLLEIILNQMSSLKNDGQSSPGDYELLLAEFRSLLNADKIKHCIKRNSRVVKELISSHGDDENMVYFAQEMEDYRYVVEHHIKRKRFKDGLDVLRNEANCDLLYEFAPLLIAEVPFDLVDALIAHGRKLDVAKLIPALVQECKDIQQNELCDEIIRYLEHCMYKLNMEEKVIANYLLALYAQANKQKLQTYLQVKGDDESMINYDLQYVLRICTELNFSSACIHLYVTMGLYEEAIDLAITEDIQYAKRIADIPDSEDLKRKLWLKIAKHIVLEEKDIQQVTEFLKECTVLKIEDILPYFPDFVTIDHFKDAICSSLKEYNRHIESLKDEMKEATENVEELREEVRELRNKHAVVRADNLCAVCGYAVISRPFHVFPCLHMFHSDCLTTELRPHLKASVRSRLGELEALVTSMSTSAKSPALGLPESPLSHGARERVAGELDEIVGSECLFCGEIMIRSIDEPFVTGGDLELAGWE